MKLISRFGLKERYLLSFFLVSIVPVMLIITLLYLPVERLFADDAIKADGIKSRQIKDIVDIRLKEIHNLSAQISSDKRIKEFLYIKQPLEASEQYSMREISDVIESYKSGNSFISFIALYFIQSSSVITNEGSYSADYFFSSILKYNNISYDQVRGFMDETHYNEYLQLSSISGNQVLNGNYITYVQSLPIGERNVLANIIILVNDNNLSTIIGDTMRDRDEQVLILSKNGGTIISKGGSDDIKPSISKGLDSGEESFVASSHQGKKLIVSSTDSAVTDWNYVVLSNMDSITAKVGKIRNLAAFIAFLCIAVGAVLSVLLAKYNYMPWNHLIKLIRTSGSKTGNCKNITDKKNEFVLARDTIESMLEEQEQLRNDVGKSRNCLKGYILQNLCMGREVTQDDVQGMQAAFPYKSFCVVMIDIDCDSHFSVPMKVFISKMAGVYYRDMVAYTFEDEKGRLCVVINVDTALSNLIFQQVTRLKEQISQHFNILLYVGVGNPYEGTEKLHTSYIEAEKSLDYSFLRGKESIVMFPDIKRDIFGALNLPVHSDNPLLNIVKTGDYKACSKLLNEYFNNITNAGEASIQYVYCLYYNFVSVIIKACEEIHADFGGIFQQSPEQLLDISRCRNSKQIIDNVYSVYLTMCTYIQKNKVNYNHSLKLQIENFIADNFSNANISLIELAEELGYSPSYLSRFMKQQFGMGFSDLLSKVRLDTAKKLLMSTTLQICDISAKTGHASINSFIRTFKRIEGITPGQYREMTLPKSGVELKNI